MASALSNLMAVLSLDSQQFIDGLHKSKKKSDSFLATFSNVGGAVVYGALTAIGAGVAAVGTAAFTAAETVDAAMDKIAVSTGATGPELEGLRDDFEAVFQSVPTDADSAATAIGILNSRLDVTGPVLQGLAAPLLEVTRIMGGDLTRNGEAFTRVIGDWSIPTEEAAGSLDKLFVAAQAAGVPLDALMERVVQYGAPMRNFNFSFEESAALLAKWEAEGVNVEIVMSGLRTAQGKFISSGKDMNEGLWETVEAIQNAGTETEGLAIATKVFGAKAAGDMFDLIRSGKFDIDDLTAAMQGADGAIMDASKSTMDWGEKWTMFKNKMTVALAPIGEKMLEGASQVVDTVGALFERPDVQAAMTSFANFAVGAISKVVEYLPVVIDAFFQLVAFLQENEGIVVGILAGLGAAAVVWGATTAAAAWTAVAPLLPVIAVILLVAAVAYLLYEAWTNNWGGIQEKTQAAWGKIQEVFRSLQEVFEGVWQRLQPAFQQIGATLETLKPQFVGAWETMKTSLIDFWDAISPVLGFIGAVILGVIVGLIQGLAQGIANFYEFVGMITSGVTALLSGIIDVVSGYLNIIVGIFTLDGERIMKGLEQVWDGIVKIFTGAFDMIIGVTAAQLAFIVGLIGGFVEGIVGFFTDLYNELVGHSIVPDMMQAILRVISGFIPDILLQFVNFILNIVDFFRNTDWQELGRMIAVGIVNGLQAMGQWALDQIINFGQAIADVLAGFFQIGSPSKLMEKQIGEPLAMGVVVGWENVLTTSPFETVLAGALETPTYNPETRSDAFEAVAVETSQGGITIHFTYAPAVSLGDRYEAEQVLAPIIADAVRRRLEQEG